MTVHFINRKGALRTACLIRAEEVTTTTQHSKVTCPDCGGAITKYPNLYQGES